MSAQPLGKLWICLCPNEEELRDCSSGLIYQQLIILEIIEQFGFNQQVLIQPPQMEGLGCIPIVQRHLHQLIHLNHTSEYLIIQDVPKVREERLYRTTGTRDTWSEQSYLRPEGIIINSKKRLKPTQ
jgi:hypothetical protein